MWKVFHDPDVSFPVVRRRLGMELLDLLNMFGEVAVSGGWAFIKNRSGVSREAYNRAVGRLSRQGLIYRNVLRQFLKAQRMGCFQKSVWITPTDIRPQYADLKEAAAVEVFACLFEAYRCAFVMDPLLPRASLPGNYMGEEVYRIHRKIVKQIRTCLLSCNPD